MCLWQERRRLLELLSRFSSRALCLRPVDPVKSHTSWPGECQRGLGYIREDGGMSARAEEVSERGTDTTN